MDGFNINPLVDLIENLYAVSNKKHILNMSRSISYHMFHTA